MQTSKDAECVKLVSVLWGQNFKILVKLRTDDSEANWVGTDLEVVLCAGATSSFGVPYRLTSSLRTFKFYTFSWEWKIVAKKLENFIDVLVIQNT